MGQPIAEVAGINMSVVVTRSPAGGDENLVQVMLPSGQILELFGRQARALAVALTFMAGSDLELPIFDGDSDLRMWLDG